MSTECERVFRSAKKLITPKRSQLEEDIIEACECLKAWWRNSLIEQQFGHFKMHGNDKGTTAAGQRLVKNKLRALPVGPSNSRNTWHPCTKNMASHMTPAAWLMRDDSGQVTDKMHKVISAVEIDRVSGRVTK
jgi:hypothetical protein